MHNGPMVGGRQQPEMRQRLVTAAANVLATQGVAGFTTRRVAAEAGASTMTVYTHFGSMEALIDAVVAEGFSLMEARLLAVKRTEDPLRDVTSQTLAYVEFAVEHRDLYGIMFGTVPLGRYQRTSPTQLQAGRAETLDRVGANLARAVDSGRLGHRRTSELAFMWWSLTHGYALLETSGHIDPGPGRPRILAGLLTALFTGLGDGEHAAKASVGSGIQGHNSVDH